MSIIIGLSGFYHDSSACLLVDGEIKIAVQEERFTRIKHDPSFPTKSLEYILSQIDSDTKIEAEAREDSIDNDWIAKQQLGKIFLKPNIILHGEDEEQETQFHLSPSSAMCFSYSES